jgi:hypothetical protein
MGLRPYRQQIGIPREAGGGVQDIADTRVQDVSGQLDNLSKSLMATAAPRLEADAIRAAQEAGGSMVLQRNDEGKLIAPERTLEGGMVYQQAFDRVISARYLSEVGGDFQKFLDDDAAARRQGEKPYEADKYAETVESYKQGMLEGVPAWLRAETEELFTREAGERVRAFTNEISRENRINFISGTLNQITNFQNKLKDREGLIREAQARGQSVDQVMDGYRAQSLSLIQTLRDKNFAGDEETKAMVFALDDEVEDVQNYFDGKELLVQFADQIGTWDASTRDQVRLALDGAIIGDGTISGVSRARTGTSEVVTGDILVAATPMIFGVKATSGPRAGNHPLSIAARNHPTRPYVSTHDVTGPGGGRAIDMPRIEGKTIEDAVVMWRAAGFKVTKWIDEYKNPSSIATGGHWHFEFGNTREVVTETTGPVEGLTAQMLAGQDPANKRVWEQLLNEADQNDRILEAERKAEARNQALIQAQRDEAQATRDTITGAMAGGVGGNWSTKERGYMEGEVEEVVNFGTLRNDPQQRQNLLGYIQQRNYVPKRAVTFLDNMVRSQDWEGALELYRGLQGATLPGGARVGDLFLSQLDSRTGALLNQADSLARSGQSFEAISARLEGVRSGQAFTLEEAIAEFNRRNGNGKKVYDTMKDTAIRNALGANREAALPSSLMQDVDNAYAANLDIYGDADAALEQAIKQVKGAYQSSTLFASRVGPSVIARSYPIETKLELFFFTETNAATGEPLVRKAPGQQHRLGGRNPSIRLVPIDSQRDTIGRYRVLVYEPNNTRNLIDVFELDLGKELREHYGTGDRKTTAVRRADLISQARTRRESTEDFNRTRSDMGLMGL